MTARGTRPARRLIRPIAGASCGPVACGAVFDLVVQDDAVVVVGDLGLVAEFHRAVDAALADRAGIGIMQADQARWTDGQVFDLTVAGAFGAAKRRLNAGLAALGEAAGHGPSAGEG